MKTKTMKLILLLFSSIIFAQVGVNTAMPSATLDVVGKPTIATELDGIIPPRLTGNQLQAKTYTSTQNGALVYITTAATSPSGQTSEVNATGIYYFNSGLNKWVLLVTNSSGQNVFTNNNDPNSATIFDDQLPAVTHNSTLIQNSQNTYYGLDGSVWIWNGTAYISYTSGSNLAVGQRVSVYRTMSSTAPDGTVLPTSGLINLDGVVRIGLKRTNATFCEPYMENISAAAIKLTKVAGNKGTTAEQNVAIESTVAVAGILDLEGNNTTYWTTTAIEFISTDVILPNGRWYEIEFMAYEVGTVKRIFMSAVRKF